MVPFSILLSPFEKVRIKRKKKRLRVWLKFVNHLFVRYLICKLSPLSEKDKEINFLECLLKYNENYTVKHSLGLSFYQ